jgi:hypothetical protein
LVFLWPFCDTNAAANKGDGAMPEDQIRAFVRETIGTYWQLSDRPAFRRDIVRIVGTIHDGQERSHSERYRLSLAVRGICKNPRSDLSFHRRRAFRFGKHRRGIVKDCLHQFD